METLKISRRKDSQNGYTFSTSHDFFKDNKEVVFSSDQYGVSFRVPSIDDIIRQPVHKNGNISYSMTIYNKEDVYTGVLEFDEEDSTDDEVYFLYI